MKKNVTVCFETKKRQMCTRGAWNKQTKLTEAGYASMHVSLPHHLNMLETRLSYIDSSNIPINTIFYLVISIQYQV